MAEAHIFSTIFSLFFYSTAPATAVNVPSQRDGTKSPIGSPEPTEKEPSAPLTKNQAKKVRQKANRAEKKQAAEMQEAAAAVREAESKVERIDSPIIPDAEMVSDEMDDEFGWQVACRNKKKKGRKSAKPVVEDTREEKEEEEESAHKAIDEKLEEDEKESPSTACNNTHSANITDPDTTVSSPSPSPSPPPSIPSSPSKGSPSQPSSPDTSHSKQPTLLPHPPSQPTPATEKPKPKPHFPLLPGELRNEIYRLALVSRGSGGEEEQQPIPVTKTRFTEPGLLKVSKQLRLEAATIFYAENTFSLDIPHYDSAVCLSWSRKTAFLWRDYRLVPRRRHSGFRQANAANFAVWLQRIHAGKLEPVVFESLEGKHVKWRIIGFMFRLAKELRTWPWESVEERLKTLLVVLGELDLRWKPDHC
jgi:hypothetical protein